MPRSKEGYKRHARRRKERSKSRKIANITHHERMIRGLVKGGVYTADRQTGKTTAILETCMALGPENCAVVALNENAAQQMLAHWREMFPDVKQPPQFISGHRDVEMLLAGRSPEIKVFVDEWWFNPYRGEFHAAIGTVPMAIEED